MRLGKASRRRLSRAIRAGRNQRAGNRERKVTEQAHAGAAEGDIASGAKLRGQRVRGGQDQGERPGPRRSRRLHALSGKPRAILTSLIQRSGENDEAPPLGRSLQRPQALEGLGPGAVGVQAVDTFGGQQGEIAREQGFARGLERLRMASGRTVQGKNASDGILLRRRIVRLVPPYRRCPNSWDRLPRG